MLEQINKLDFNGVDIYVGIDTHKKNWKVSIFVDDMMFKTFSQNPCAVQLHDYLKKINEDGFSINSVKTRTDAVKWAFDFHNLINEDLSKKQYTIQDLKLHYDF